MVDVEMDQAPLVSSRRRLLRRWAYEINSLSLTLSIGVTGILGIAYWALAAKLFDAAEVGRASAIISSMTMLATLANLSLGPMFERFLAVAGPRPGRYLIKAHLLTAALAVVLGIGFMIFGPTAKMFTHGWEQALFPLFVAVQAAFALQDSELVGLRVARWAALKNVAHAAGKIVALLAVVWTYSGFSIALSWLVVSGVVVVMIATGVRRRWLPVFVKTIRDELPERRQLWSYFGSQYGITVIGSLPGLVIPLIVLDQLGQEATAHFNLAWVLVVAFLMLIGTAVSPFVSEVVARPEAAPRLFKRFVAMLALIGVGAALFLGLLAPWFLDLLGREYGADGGALLRYMAFVMPMAAFGACYGALARIERRMRLLVVLQIITSVLLVVAVRYLVETSGLAGVGMSYVLTQALGTVVIAAPLIRSIRRLADGSATEVK